MTNTQCCGASRAGCSRFSRLVNIEKSRPQVSTDKLTMLLDSKVSGLMVIMVIKTNNQRERKNSENKKAFELWTLG